MARYGLESGAIERTSMRAERWLPIGMRTIEPRSIGEALISFGASKCGSRRRYALTLELRMRQISSALLRMRSTYSQAKDERLSSPLGSQKRFFSPLAIDM